MNEIQKEDDINFYRLTYFVNLCKSRKNNIPQDKREEYKNLLDDVQIAWDSFGSIFPTFFYSKVRRKTKTLNSYALGRRNSERILLRTQKGN